MQTGNNWLDGIKKQVAPLKGILSDKDYKKFKLDTLLCIAERLTQFSHECGQCHMLQQDVTTLAQNVNNLVYSTDKEKRKAYQKSMSRITGHLQKQHKLVTEGYYTGIMTAMGSAVGVTLGAALGNVGTGISIGTILGTVIGATLDVKARKEGRILCPRETTSGSKLGMKIGIVLGVILLAGLVLFFFLRRSG